MHHIHALDQQVDLLTKALPRQRFQTLKFKIGVSDSTSILRGAYRGSYKSCIKSALGIVTDLLIYCFFISLICTSHIAPGLLYISLSLGIVS